MPIRWEYMSWPMPVGDSKNLLTAYNNLGREGWEHVETGVSATLFKRQRQACEAGLCDETALYGARYCEKHAIEKVLSSSTSAQTPDAALGRGRRPC